MWGPRDLHGDIVVGALGLGPAASQHVLIALPVSRCNGCGYPEKLGCYQKGRRSAEGGGAKGASWAGRGP